MEPTEFFARISRLNLPELRLKRPDWTDRLPLLPNKPSVSARPLVVWHWAYVLPDGAVDRYMLWLARRRHRRNLEQIEIDELDEICETDDAQEARALVYARQEERRVASRFHVATREAAVFRRQAARWDVDAPKMIWRGVANEEEIARVRREVREARWLFVDRCAKLLIPVLSLLVALAALLRR